MRKKDRYSWRERFYSFLISALCICAVVLAVAIVVDARLNSDRETTVTKASVPADGSTPEPLTLKMAEPSPSVTPEPTAAAPTVVPEATEPPFEFLPVYSKVNTEENVIAITLDDCSHQTYVRYAALAAQEAGAKLTLFPIGQNVMHEGMDELLRTCVLELGFEVENRSWSNGLVYRMTESELAAEIWSADVAVDYVLNKNYDMHFFRMRGGLGARDARTHVYLRQLGYEAIVTWSVVAADNDLDGLKQSLKPGNIYLFSSSEEDVKKLIEFVKYAARRGYRMVTLNELLGYEENACTDPEESILTQTMPLLENYEPLMLTCQTGDRSWQVLLIQSRLAELGYLSADGADGVFGASTSSAVSAFQVNSGLMGTGVATTETQLRLFADGAPAYSGPTATPGPASTPESTATE